MLLVVVAVDNQVVVEQVVDTLVAAVAASLAAVADQKSVRSAGHPYFAALLIFCLRDVLLHRLLHLLRQFSGVVFFFF
jgi:hypothetical protein